MNVQFVDSYYLLALLNTKDQGHTAAIRHQQTGSGKLLTTTWVLVEVADALSSVGARLNAARFIRAFCAEPYVEVLPPTSAQFERALDRYEQRPDKDWSMTDCISFLVMEERGRDDLARNGVVHRTE